MARCVIGKKKIEKYRKQTGFPIVAALTRGNTHHRIDLILENGTTVPWYNMKKNISNIEPCKPTF